MTIDNINLSPIILHQDTAYLAGLRDLNDPNDYKAIIDAAVKSLDSVEIGNGTAPETLCQYLTRMMDNVGITAKEEFADVTRLGEQFYDKIINNRCNNMTRETLMSICVGIKANYAQIIEIFDHSMHRLRTYDDMDVTFLKIILKYPGIDIDSFNAILGAKKLPILGSKNYNT